MSAKFPAEIRAKLEAGELGFAVEVGNIEKQLDQFFDDDNTRTRASLTNFAIYSEDPSRALENNELLAAITLDHACRALLIILDQDDADCTGRVQCWINAHCHMDERGGKSVCSEQISFLLEGKCTGLVANVVFANLRSDLPLVMWWQGDLTANFEERLYSRIDRLIVDSCSWQDAKGQFAILNAALAKKGRLEQMRDSFLFHDLSHTRGHRYRLAVAHAFDDARVREALLPAIDHIVIRHGTGCRNAAMYLGAWLATQLDAPFQLRSGDRYVFTGPRSDLVIELRAAGNAEVSIEELKLSAPGAEVIVAPDRDKRHLQVRTKLPGHETDEVLPAPCQSLEALVGEVLMRGGHNQLLNKIFPKYMEMISA